MSENFYVDQLKQFCGKKIDRILVDEYADEDKVYFGLLIGDKALWFLSDDEGNAPGSFEIQAYHHHES